MFSIKIEVADIVENDIWVFGEKTGYVNGTKELYDADDKNKKYTIKAIPIIRYIDSNKVLTHKALILEPGDYDPKDLIGKTLISDE